MTYQFFPPPGSAPSRAGYYCCATLWSFMVSNGHGKV